MSLPEKFRVTGVLLFMALLVSSLTAERINHEGRILGTVPEVTNAILFNTAQADAIISALQIFPRDHAWNEDISRRPVLANSAAMLHLITTNLATGGTGRTNLRAFQEMNFVLVPDNQPRLPMTLPKRTDTNGRPVRRALAAVSRSAMRLV